MQCFEPHRQMALLRYKNRLYNPFQTLFLKIAQLPVYCMPIIYRSRIAMCASRLFPIKTPPNDTSLPNSIMKAYLKNWQTNFFAAFVLAVQMQPCLFFAVLFLSPRSRVLNFQPIDIIFQVRGGAATAVY